MRSLKTKNTTKHHLILCSCLSCCFTFLPAITNADAVNPFARPEQPRSSQGQDVKLVPANLELQGTLVGDGTPLATINGKLYFPGDPLGSYVIGEISADAVLLYQGDKSTLLTLRGDEREPAQSR